MWGQALTIAGISIESELRAPDKVYYPPALHLAPNPTQLAVDPIFVSASAQPTIALAATPMVEKEQDQPPLLSVVDVDSEEATKVGQLKRKKKEKEKEKQKEKEASV